MTLVIKAQFKSLANETKTHLSHTIIFAEDANILCAKRPCYALIGRASHMSALPVIHWLRLNVDIPRLPLSL